MRKFAFIVVGALALVLGLAAPASAGPADPDTNGGQPGTHTAIVNNPYGGARLVVYYHRETANPFPWTTNAIKVDLAVSQDLAPGTQSHRITMTGQNGAAPNKGLLVNTTDTGTGPTVGQVGGWDDFRTTGGEAPALSPVVVVQAQQGQAEGDGPFVCPVLSVVLNAAVAPGSPNSVLLAGCNG
jgi:hypothetical protein